MEPNKSNDEVKRRLYRHRFKSFMGSSTRNGWIDWLGKCGSLNALRALQRVEWHQKQLQDVWQLHCTAADMELVKELSELIHAYEVLLHDMRRVLKARDLNVGPQPPAPSYEDEDEEEPLTISASELCRLGYRPTADMTQWVSNDGRYWKRSGQDRYTQIPAPAGEDKQDISHKKEDPMNFTIIVVNTLAGVRSQITDQKDNLVIYWESDPVNLDQVDDNGKVIKTKRQIAMDLAEAKLDQVTKGLFA